MLRGLRTGNFDLNSPKKELAHNILQLLYNYLDSYQHIRLNDSFAINFKILSVEHMKEKKKKAGAAGNYEEDRYIGCDTCLPHDDPGRPADASFLFVSPHGFPSVPDGFQNLCLILSIVVGLAWFEKQETGFGNYDAFMELHQRKRKRNISIDEIHRRAGLKLYDCMHQLLLELQAKGLQWIPGNPIHGKDLPHICDFLNIQIHVFSSVHNQHVYSFPHGPTDTRKQLNLYEVSGVGDTVHFHYINNPGRFRRFHGSYCHWCNKTFTYSYYKHMCANKKHKMCLACRRPKQTETTYINTLIKKTLCQIPTNEEDESSCPKCNLTSPTQECSNTHGKECRKGWLCPLCKKYFSTSGTLPTQARLQADHKCNVRKCRYCSTQDNNIHHLCSFKLDKMKKSWHRLGFFHFEFVDTSRGHCQQCHEIACTEHKDLYFDDDLYPNLCVALIETKREIFQHRLFGEATVLEQAKPLHSDNTYIPYLPEDLKNLDFENTVPPRNWGKSPKRKIPATLKHGLSVQEDFLYSILKEDLINTTFLTHSTNGSLPALLDAIYRHLLKPHVVRANGKLMSIDLYKWGLRFVDICSYVPMSEEKIQEVYFEPSYFPHKLNHPDFYSRTRLPEIADAMEFNDSLETQGKKTAFFEQVMFHQEPWMLGEDLARHSINIVKSIGYAAAEFIKESLVLQDHIRIKKQEISKEIQIPLFLNPFNPPIISKAAFIMQVFRAYMLEPGDLYAVKNEEEGLGRKMSRGEYQWLCYKEMKKPSARFISAFSAYGQKYFKETVPDIYEADTKYAAYYNGCEIHGHTAATCAIMKGKPRNFRGQSCQDVENQFYKKVELLKEHHQDEIHEVEVMWECEWRTLTKTPEIAAFLKTLPLRPMHHLRARDACEYKRFTCTSTNLYLLLPPILPQCNFNLINKYLFLQIMAARRRRIIAHFNTKISVTLIFSWMTKPVHTVQHA